MRRLLTFSLLSLCATPAFAKLPPVQNWPPIELCSSHPAGADGAVLCETDTDAGWPYDVFGTGKDGASRELRISKPQQTSPGCSTVHLDYFANNQYYLTETASACLDGSGYFSNEQLEIASPQVGTWWMRVTPAWEPTYDVQTQLIGASGNAGPVDSGWFAYEGKQFNSVSFADLSNFSSVFAQAAYFDGVVQPIHLKLPGTSPIAIKWAATDIVNRAVYPRNPANIAAGNGLLAAIAIMQLVAVEPAGGIGGGAPGNTHPPINKEQPVNCNDTPHDDHCFGPSKLPPSNK